MWSLLEKILCKVLKYEDITKNINGEEVLYLRRFFIWGNKPSAERTGGRICLHIIHRSDEDRAPHTHPWPFWTLILRNGYLDESWNLFYKDGKRTCYVWLMEQMTPGKFAYREASHLHRVKLIGGKPAWTLVWMGKPIQRWGFVTDDGKWIYHKDYLSSGKAS